MPTYAERYNTEEKLEANRAYKRKWIANKRKTDPKYNITKMEREYRGRLKMRVMNYLGGAICCNCGCNVIEILEINHIYGGGRRETNNYKGGYKQFYRDILNGKLKRENYNVLCKVCNTLHYISNIKGVRGHKVIWNKPDA